MGKPTNALRRLSETTDRSDLDHDFQKLILRFRFARDLDVPAALRQCASRGLGIKMMDATFFLSRETAVAPAPACLGRDKLFFSIASQPSDRVRRGGGDLMALRRILLT
jgi:KUP system potassium uptake protein